MKLKHLLLLTFLVSFAKLETSAQQSLPFWNEVQDFKKQDSLRFPASNQILLIGSSSFTYWKDVQEYFPRHTILNRAFGGSSLPDLIRYRYEILYPYQPKQILIYCGENDFAASDTVTVETVVNRFVTFFGLLRAKYKNVPVGYVSMKPSPSRLSLLPKFKEANQRIQQYLATQPKTTFIDIYQDMLLANGSVMEDIFLKDRLHMNAKGYAIWKKRIQKVLIK
jgi:lysophospholipase L1-like esterase